MMVEKRNPSVRSSLIVCVVAMAVFLGIALKVRHPNPTPAFDTEIADALHQSKVDSPGWTHFFDHVKELAGLEVLIGLVVVVGAVLLYHRRYWLAAAWAVAVEGAAIANDRVLKFIFQRERPPYGRPKGYTDWSFPSGHSLRAIVLYGLIAYLLVLVLPKRWARIVAVTALALVVALIGFSRIYLGKHYCSDVMGSFAFGTGWLAAWIALIEVMGWAARKPPAGTV